MRTSWTFDFHLKKIVAILLHIESIKKEDIAKKCEFICNSDGCWQARQGAKTCLITGEAKHNLEWKIHRDTRVRANQTYLRTNNKSSATIWCLRLKFLQEFFNFWPTVSGFHDENVSNLKKLVKDLNTFDINFSVKNTVQWSLIILIISLTFLYQRL